MNAYNDSDKKVYDARTDTFISMNNDKPIDKPSDKSIINKNERVIWTFTIGVQIDIKTVYEYEIQTENFENAVFEMTKEITNITDGLTYNYCHGMWLRKKQSCLEITPLVNENNSNSNSNNIEHNLSVQISIIVLPEIENEVYNFVKHIISKVNKKYELGLIHVQAMKTSGTSHHFVLE
jgi:hypothetical protein